MARRRQVKLSILIPLGILFAASGLLWVTQTKQNLVSRADNTNSPESRNKLREQSISDIASAVKQYLGTNNKVALTLPSTPTGICSGVTASCKTTKLIDLNMLISRGYINQIPSDPMGGFGRFVSGYEIVRSRTTGEVTVSAPRAEGKVLSVTVQP